MATTNHILLSDCIDYMLPSGLVTHNFLCAQTVTSPNANYEREPNDILRAAQTEATLPFTKADYGKCLGSIILFNNNSTKKVTVTKIESQVNVTNLAGYQLSSTFDFDFCINSNTITSGIDITSKLVPLDSANSVPVGISIRKYNSDEAVGNTVLKFVKSGNVNFWGAALYKTYNRSLQGLKSKDNTTQAFTLNPNESFVFRFINPALTGAMNPSFHAEVIISIDNKQYSLCNSFYLRRAFGKILFSINNDSGSSIVIKVMSFYVKSADDSGLQTNNMVGQFAHNYAIMKIFATGTPLYSAIDFGDALPANIITGMYAKVEYKHKDLYGNYAASIACDPDYVATMPNPVNKISKLNKNIVLNYGEGISLITNPGYPSSINQLGSLNNIAEQLYTIYYKVEDVPSSASGEYAYSSVQ